jgi:hypothetical protein
MVLLVVLIVVFGARYGPEVDDDADSADGPVADEE